MKLSKDNIREMVGIVGRSVLVADDGFHNLSCWIDNSVNKEATVDHYRRSKFCLSFTTIVTHRAQETDAVMENVSKSIHDSLYREIIVNLHQIRHTSRVATRDEIEGMLTRLINRIDS